jgi:hypothetical protein
MKMSKISALAATVAGVAVSAMPALAQTLPPITVSADKANIKIMDLGQLISGVVGAALLISGILVFAYLIIGGIGWATSGGDKGKTEAARNKITAALIGLAIVAASFAVMQIIGFFFGVNIFGSGITDTIQKIRPY